MLTGGLQNGHRKPCYRWELWHQVIVKDRSESGISNYWLQSRAGYVKCKVKTLNLTFWSNGSKRMKEEKNAAFEVFESQQPCKLVRQAQCMYQRMHGLIVEDKKWSRQQKKKTNTLSMISLVWLVYAGSFQELPKTSLETENKQKTHIAVHYISSWNTKMDAYS